MLRVCWSQAEEKALEAELLEAEAKVDAALLDSIDVCSAMTALFKLISSTNTYMKNGEAQYAADPKGASLFKLHERGSVIFTCLQVTCVCMLQKASVDLPRVFTRSVRCTEHATPSADADNCMMLNCLILLVMAIADVCLSGKENMQQQVQVQRLTDIPLMLCAKSIYALLIRAATAVAAAAPGGGVHHTHPACFRHRRRG